MKPHTELFELALRAGGDLGGKSVEDLVKLMHTGQELPRIYIGDLKSDPISVIIYNAFTNVDMEDIQSDLKYAIKQLQSALNVIQENASGAVERKKEDLLS